MKIFDPEAMKKAMQGWTVIEIHQATGIARQTIYNYLNGTTTSPGSKTLGKIATLFKRKVDFFFKEGGE